MNKQCREKELNSIKRYENFPVNRVILSNLQTFSIYIIGAIILSYLSITFAVIYIFYCIFSLIFIWKFVCVHCYYYDKICSSGYGKISAMISKKGDLRKFKNKFKYLVGVVSPAWFIPLIAGIIQIAIDFSWLLLFMVLIFIVIAFIILPIESKKYSCKHCKQQNLCGWGRK